MNPRKKTAIIFIKSSNGSKVVINPNDLKEIIIEGTDVTFVTSSVTRTFKFSNYAINDKLKPGFRERYNILDVEANRPLRFQDNSKPHNLTLIHEPGRVTCIFPKGLKGARLATDSVTVHGYKQHWTVAVNRQEGDDVYFEAVPVSNMVKVTG